MEAEIAENEKYVAAAEDLSDIEHKFNGGMDGYDALYSSLSPLVQLSSMSSRKV